MKLLGIMLFVSLANVYYITNSTKKEMKKVTGIGGVFFKTKDPKTLNAWYVQHLGFTESEHGQIVFEWRDKDDPEKKGQTV